MTNKEVVTRNIGLSFDFMKQIISNPEILEKIDNKSTIEFLQKDYSEREKIRRTIPDKFIKVKRNFEVI